MSHRVNQSDRRRVVITGIGPVTPIGVGLEALLDGICSGRSGIGPITLFDASGYEVRIAAEVAGVDPRAILGDAEPESVLRDRKIAHAVLATRLALTDAFGAPKLPADARHAPLHLGIGLEVLLLDHLAASESRRARPEERATVPGGSEAPSAFAGVPEDEHFLRVPLDRAARTIADRFELDGPVHSNVGACVAGAQAIGHAFHAVRRGTADVALAGGADSMVNPMGLGGFTLLSALSTQNELGPGASRPFDRRRDGLVLGEGAAILVLEERDRALARGATIHAELRGYGTSLDAHRVTAPPPDGEGAQRAMRAALADASVDPSEVDYVNAHGTSTPQNDPSETAAIKAVLGARARQIPVSSTKSQIGHTIAAAGAIETAVTALALARGIVPPTINTTELDPACDLDYVLDGSRKLPSMRIAQTDSFGFGGQNAVLVLAKEEGA